jgi:hypothetical protein
MSATQVQADQIPEASAQGRVKAAYDDVKRSLRIPFVPYLFRALAARFPDYLDVAWQQLGPNVRIMYFESMADEERSVAVQGMRDFGPFPAAPEDPGAGGTLELLHYTAPKMLLLIAAMRAATRGQEPKLQELPADQRKQIAVGVPASAPAHTAEDSGAREQQILALPEDIRSAWGARLSKTCFSELASWPGYLESSWNALQPVMASPAHRSLQKRLNSHAEQAITCLPYRIELNPHTLRNAGLSEADLDGIRAMLSEYGVLMPALVCDIAFLASGAFGVDRANISPFPL